MAVMVMADTVGDIAAIAEGSRRSRGPKVVNRQKSGIGAPLNAFLAVTPRQC